MYLCFKNLIPESLSKCFVLKSEVHSYNTRNPYDYKIPRARLNARFCSIFYKGPKIWNKIPIEIRNSPSLNTFKRRYKKFLLDRYNE